MTDYFGSTLKPHIEQELIMLIQSQISIINIGASTNTLALNALVVGAPLAASIGAVRGNFALMFNMHSKLHCVSFMGQACQLVHITCTLHTNMNKKN